MRNDAGFHAWKSWHLIDGKWVPSLQDLWFRFMCDGTYIRNSWLMNRGGLETPLGLWRWNRSLRRWNSSWFRHKKPRNVVDGQRLPISTPSDLTFDGITVLVVFNRWHKARFMHMLTIVICAHPFDVISIFWWTPFFDILGSACGTNFMMPIGIHGIALGIVTSCQNQHLLPPWLWSKLTMHNGTKM